MIKLCLELYHRKRKKEKPKNKEAGEEEGLIRQRRRTQSQFWL